jgi:NSS family neurotransmitter:Na+ symporter
MLCGGITWLVGLGTVFSFNIWKTYTVFGKTVFDVLDFLTSNIMLPLGGLLIAVFVGWSMRESSVRDEIAMSSDWLFQVWRFLIRFVTPVGVMLIFLNVIGII